jgi:fluoroacetyl-CoA thioesterase
VSPLEPGIERTDEFTAADRLLTDVGGTLGVKVLSTPGMIAMMERCASKLAFENLPDGKATVGFEVCVTLRFAVEVRESDRTIGVGTHERRVVDHAGFGS